MRKLTLSVMAIVVLSATCVTAQETTQRDPFRFGEKTGAAKKTMPSNRADFIPTLILIRGDKKIVIINGKKLRKGDSFSGGVITGIKLDSVTILKNGGKKVFRVGKRVLLNDN